MSRTGPKDLKVVSNWKLCADLKSAFYMAYLGSFIIRHCCHGNKFTKHKIVVYCMEADILLVDV